MAQLLFIQKSSSFRSLKTIPSLSPDPKDYPIPTGLPNDNDSYQKKMEQVIDDSTHTPKKGGWYSATCIAAAAGTGNGREDENIYTVFFALDSVGEPIVNNNTSCAAPCPPFCADDNP